jgi:hypothetical protein
MHHRFAHGMRRLVVTLTSVPVVCSGLQKREPAATQVFGARDDGQSDAAVAVGVEEPREAGSGAVRGPVSVFALRLHAEFERSVRLSRRAGGVDDGGGGGRFGRWPGAAIRSLSSQIGPSVIGRWTAIVGSSRCRAVVAFRLSDVTGDSGKRTPTQPSRAWREKRHL